MKWKDQLGKNSDNLKGPDDFYFSWKNEEMSSSLMLVKRNCNV